MTDDTKPKAPTRAAGPKRSADASMKDAKKKLATMKAREEERRHEEEYASHGQHDWFVRCRGCNGIGVFLKQYPTALVVEPDNWYSEYREDGMVFISSEIPCQECGQNMGPEFPEGFRKGRWKVPKRFYQSLGDMEDRAKKAQLERLNQKAMSQARLSIMDAEAGS